MYELNIACCYPTLPDIAIVLSVGSIGVFSLPVTVLSVGVSGSVIVSPSVLEDTAVVVEVVGLEAVAIVTGLVVPGLHSQYSVSNFEKFATVVANTGKNIMYWIRSYTILMLLPLHVQ